MLHVVSWTNRASHAEKLEKVWTSIQKRYIVRGMIISKCFCQERACDAGEPHNLGSSCMRATDQ
jgi:hypothetical protein